MCTVLLKLITIKTNPRDFRTRVAQFRIHRIIFFARGHAESDEKSCFAFTCATGDGQSHNHVIQCHVFRCHVPEAVNKIFVSFAKAFKKPEGEQPTRFIHEQVYAFIREKTS